MRTETGVVEAIEASTRTVTLKKPDGTFVPTVAGPDIKRFAEVKVGDKVNARYYENVIVRLKRPGESEVASATKATTGSDQALPGGTKAKQRQITATISAIDMAMPSVSFTGPNGWKYTSKVQDVGGSRQGEGRRQGRNHLDRSDAGVGRARQVSVCGLRPGRSAVIAPVGGERNFIAD